MKQQQRSTLIKIVFLHLVLCIASAYECARLAYYPAHTAMLSGPLSLHDGIINTAQAIVLHSTRTLRNTTQMRAVLYLIDPIHQHNPVLHFDNTTKQHGHLLPPDWQQNLTHPPQLRLQPVKYLNRVVHENISIPYVVPRAPSNMMKTLNATTQRYSYLWGMLKAHGPLHYRVMLDVEGVIATQPGCDWALCVEDWWHCARVPAAVLLGGLGWHDQGGDIVQQETHWLVLKSFFAASIDAAAARVFAVLTHHIQLGFAGALLYDNGGYEAALRAHPLLHVFFQHDQLRIVQWIHADLYPASSSQSNQWPEYFNYMQEMVYTHAALSTWGSNTYLLFTDVDEFLVLPNMAQRLGAIPPMPLLGDSHWRYMQVQRINYLCDVAPGEEHQATQHQHDYGTSTNSTTRHVLQPYMQCRKTPREPWMDWPKVWAHADALASMVVHEGLVWPEEANSTMAPVPTSQALLVHVHNLFFDRTNQPEGDALVEDDTWLLPLRRAHEGIV